MRLKKASTVGYGMNAKGKGIKRVLMFPHQKLSNVLKMGYVKELVNSDDVKYRFVRYRTHWVVFRYVRGYSL